MEVSSNIEQLIQKLLQLAERTDIDFSEPLIAGLNAALGEMKFRIFNTGHDSKKVSFGKYVGKKSKISNRRFKLEKGATDEQKKEAKKLKKRLGKNAAPGEAYTEYEKERLSHGRQVSFKDLEFLGSLRRGLIVGKVSDNKAAIAIPNKKLFLIAEGLSKQTSKLVGQELKIFSLSEAERATMTTTRDELLNQLYARLIHS